MNWMARTEDGGSGSVPQGLGVVELGICGPDLSPTGTPGRWGVPAAGQAWECSAWEAEAKFFIPVGLGAVWEQGLCLLLPYSPTAYVWKIA